MSQADKNAAMIRVDQAGEYGATRIYAGQLAVMGDRHPMAREIAHMAEQEERHRKFFDDMIAKRGVRPTALQPFWNVAGFGLGAVTALIGPKAAMACTVAVEEVIDEHYREQIAALPDEEGGLKETLEKFRREEVEHKNEALERGAEQAPGYEPLAAAIKAGSRLAIWLSSRI